MFHVKRWLEGAHIVPGTGAGAGSETKMDHSEPIATTDRSAKERVLRPTHRFYFRPASTPGILGMCGSVCIQ